MSPLVKLSRYARTMLLGAVLLAVIAPACSAAERPTMNLGAAELLYNKANTEYQQQRYGEARELYSQIIRAGIQSADVFYNMGNACARLGKTGEAVLNYERARRLAPRDPELATNLKKIAPADNDPQHFILFRPFFWIVGSFSLGEWLGTFFTFFFLAAITGAFYYAVPMRGYTPWLRRAFYGFGVLTCILGVFAGAQYQHESTEYSVVMKPNAPIYSGPGEKFSQLVTAPEGTKLQRLSFSNDPTWAQVMLMDGQKGFTLMQNLESI